MSPYAAGRDTVGDDLLHDILWTFTGRTGDHEEVGAHRSSNHFINLYIPMAFCSYLQVDPFKSNLLLQGYAGLYCYVLWKEKLESNGWY